MIAWWWLIVEAVVLYAGILGLEWLEHEAAIRRVARHPDTVIYGSS